MEYGALSRASLLPSKGCVHRRITCVNTGPKAGLSVCLSPSGSHLPSQSCSVSQTLGASNSGLPPPLSVWCGHPSGTKKSPQGDGRQTSHMHTRILSHYSHVHTHSHAQRLAHVHTHPPTHNSHHHSFTVSQVCTHARTQAHVLTSAAHTRTSRHSHAHAHTHAPPRPAPSGPLPPSRPSSLRGFRAVVCSRLGPLLQLLALNLIHTLM